LIKHLVRLSSLLTVLILFSCNQDVIPKPKAVLKLEYPKARYKAYLSDCPFSFDSNSSAEVEKPKGKVNYCGINLSYSGLKGKIHITYQAVDDNLLTELIKDAQNLTQEHTKVAEGIKPSQFENIKHNTYGMVYEVEGDAATPVQFYVTDNKKHFLRGAVYFSVKPNYDSILPAAHYLKKDVLVLMESLKWKD
jgi:gliding motility-associated lipoprotein GldD